MAKTAFPYVPFPIAANPAHPQGTTAHRPLAIATITASNGNSLRWIVLPDSGADSCLFPLRLAIMLKLDVLQLPKDLTGAGDMFAGAFLYGITHQVAPHKAASAACIQLCFSVPTFLSIRAPSSNSQSGS